MTIKDKFLTTMEILAQSMNAQIGESDVYLEAQNINGAATTVTVDEEPTTPNYGIVWYDMKKLFSDTMRRHVFLDDTVYSISAQLIQAATTGRTVNGSRYRNSAPGEIVSTVPTVDRRVNVTTMDLWTGVEGNGQIIFDDVYFYAAPPSGVDSRITADVDITNSFNMPNGWFEPTWWTYMYTRINMAAVEVVDVNRPDVQRDQLVNTHRQAVFSFCNQNLTAIALEYMVWKMFDALFESHPEAYHTGEIRGNARLAQYVNIIESWPIPPEYADAIFNVMKPFKTSVYGQDITVHQFPEFYTSRILNEPDCGVGMDIRPYLLRPATDANQINAYAGSNGSTSGNIAERFQAGGFQSNGNTPWGDTVIANLHGARHINIWRMLVRAHTNWAISIRNKIEANFLVHQHLDKAMRWFSNSHKYNVDASVSTNPERATCMTTRSVYMTDSVSASLKADPKFEQWLLRSNGSFRFSVTNRGMYPINGQYYTSEVISLLKAPELLRVPQMDQVTYRSRRFDNYKSTALYNVSPPNNPFTYHERVRFNTVSWAAVHGDLLPSVWPNLAGVQNHDLVYTSYYFLARMHGIPYLPGEYRIKSMYVFDNTNKVVTVNKTFIDMLYIMGVNEGLPTTTPPTPGPVYLGGRVDNLVAHGNNRIDWMDRFDVRSAYAMFLPRRYIISTGVNMNITVEDLFFPIEREAASDVKKMNIIK